MWAAEKAFPPLAWLPFTAVHQRKYQWLEHQKEFASPREERVTFKSNPDVGSRKGKKWEESSWKEDMRRSRGQSENPRWGKEQSVIWDIGRGKLCNSCWEVVDLRIFTKIKPSGQSCENTALLPCLLSL
jgi:hypothetical protein